MRRRTIIITILVVVILATIGILYYAGALPSFGPCLKQQLYADGDGTANDNFNAVIIPECAVKDGNTIEIIFASVWDYFDIIFYYDGSDWSSYIKGEPAQTLYTVIPGETYRIHVNQDCILEI